VKATFVRSILLLLSQGQPRGELLSGRGEEGLPRIAAKLLRV